jgi:predicted dehydrogenase
MSLNQKNNSQIYTAALVGTGRIGFSLGFDKKREQPASHTMALLGNKRIKLIAAADTDVEHLAEWKKFVKGTETFSSSKEMYRDIQTPDIITIAVNEDSHMSECLAAIAAKPRLIILEKPVALNSTEAEEIAAASEKAGVPVMVNHERRFAEDYIKAKDYIKGTC